MVSGVPRLRSSLTPAGVVLLCRRFSLSLPLRHGGQNAVRGPLVGQRFIVENFERKSAGGSGQARSFCELGTHTHALSCSLALQCVSRELSQSLGGVLVSR